jgi:hypothetical protein
MASASLLRVHRLTCHFTVARTTHSQQQHQHQQQQKRRDSDNVDLHMQQAVSSSASTSGSNREQSVVVRQSSGLATPEQHLHQSAALQGQGHIPSLLPPSPTSPPAPASLRLPAARRRGTSVSRIYYVYPDGYVVRSGVPEDVDAIVALWSKVSTDVKHLYQLKNNF